MKTRSKFVAALLAASVSAGALIPLAHAEAIKGTPSTESAAVVTTPAKTSKAEVATATEINLSGVGRNAVTGIQYAKIALEQGQADAAKDILSQVNGMFSDNDGALIMKTDAGYALPLDAGFSVPEGFQPSKAHEVAFSKAETLMQNGDIDAVISTLTDAGVDVVAQVAVLPYATTVDGVKQAVADLDAGHVDKAKTALDSIIATVKVETFAPNALPTQGYTMTDILQG